MQALVHGRGDWNLVAFERRESRCRLAYDLVGVDVFGRYDYEAADGSGATLSIDHWLGGYRLTGRDAQV